MTSGTATPTERKAKNAKASEDAKKRKRTQRAPPKTSGSAYDAFKEFEGKLYTGAKVGRRQKWYYDKGEWKERKITPDQWEIQYTTPKRRAGKAPEGSGVPVGTEYHWYILAHQFVRKMDANKYTTDMVGVKFKVAHKRADKESWSASDRAQRKRLATFLRQVLEELEAGGSEIAEAAPSEKPMDAKPARRAKATRKRKAQPHKRSRKGAHRSRTGERAATGA